MAVPALKSVIYPAKGKHTATLIFSHGLGDTGHGWSFLADHLEDKFPYLKFIFPNAPVRPITLNMGHPMPAWFDVRTLRAPTPGDPRGQEDENGILDSVSKIHGLVDAEIKAGIDESRIVVGGFSQGAALSLLVALTTEKKLGGVIALSGWLPLDHKAKELRTAGTESTRILMGHGTSDPVVQFPWGERSYKALKDELNMTNIEFKAYKGLAHSASDAELLDVAKFIEKVVPPV